MDRAGETTDPSFADWFALRTVPEDLVEATWYSGVSSRVGESCLDRLDGPALDEPLPWLQLATTALLGNAPSLGPLLTFLTPPLEPTADERMIYEALHLDVRGERFPGCVSRVLEATEARDDFAGAALLRGAIWRLQTGRR